MKCSRVPSFRCSMPAHSPVAPAARAALTTASSCSGRSESPGRMGAIPTPTSIPAATSFSMAQPLAGVRRARFRLAPDVVVQRGDAEGDVELGPPREAGEHVDVADDHRPAGDHRGRIREVVEGLEALPGQAVPTFGGLVGIGGRPYDDRLFAPRAARELATQHSGNVGFDPDGAAIAIVGWAVRAKLERADVAKGAAVLAACIRVERPRKAHVLDRVER